MKKSGNTNSHWPLLCFLIGMLFLITCGREWNSVLDPESDLPVDGLVAYYPFNGNAEDESERAQHGTVSGATLAEDRFGNQNRAYYFDGHSYIKASANGLPTDVRTVSLWFYANSLYTIHIILGYGGNSAWGGPGSSWFMGVDGVHFRCPPITAATRLNSIMPASLLALGFILLSQQTRPVQNYS